MTTILCTAIYTVAIAGAVLYLSFLCIMVVGFFYGIRNGNPFGGER